MPQALTTRIVVTVGGNDTAALKQALRAAEDLAPKIDVVDAQPADGSMQELPTLRRIQGFCRDHPNDLVS